MDPGPAIRRAAEAEPRSVLWESNAVLAAPLARFFGMLGVAPGQLSIQSLTLTAVGLLRMATGDRSHLVQGALIVYVGLLMDRADDLLAQRAGGRSDWTSFLGMLVDRAVEIALLAMLAFLAGRAGDPSWLPTAWEPLGHSAFRGVAVAALGAVLLHRFAQAYADLMAVRSHLLGARRIPGPSPLDPARRVRMGYAQRDALVLIWCLGVISGQIQATVLTLALLHSAAFVHVVADRFHSRRDPEAHASRVVAHDYHP